MYSSYSRTLLQNGGMTVIPADQTKPATDRGGHHGGYDNLPEYRVYQRGRARRSSRSIVRRLHKVTGQRPDHQVFRHARFGAEACENLPHLPVVARPPPRQSTRRNLKRWQRSLPYADSAMNLGSAAAEQSQRRLRRRNRRRRRPEDRRCCRSPDLSARATRRSSWAHKPVSLPSRMNGLGAGSPSAM